MSDKETIPPLPPVIVEIYDWLAGEGKPAPAPAPETDQQ